LQNRGVARATGVAALSVSLLYAVGVVTGSLVSLPGSDALPSAVLQFSTAHRGGLLAAVVLNGIAWCALMPAVFVGLRALVSPDGRIVATVALAAASVEAALIGVVLLFGGLGAYAAPNLTPASAKLLSDGFALAMVASAWPTVPCALGAAVAIRRTATLPRSLAVGGIVVASVHAVASVSVARSGAFSPGGFAVLAAPAFAIWMAMLGAVLLRRPVPLPVPAAVTA
jgi:hypothetical protein